MNEQILLDLIRSTGPMSHAELVTQSGLSKATVASALTRVTDAGLVGTAGQRTGRPGPAATLYDIRPQAGYVLGLDVGHEYLRGAIVDLRGRDHARMSVPVVDAGGAPRAKDAVAIADALCAEAGVGRADVAQTVIGSPGVYDPTRDALDLVGSNRSWASPNALELLRDAFGANLVVENDVNAAALAESKQGHGVGVGSFAFVSVGTGVGMGLVIDGRLHRGAHGIAGEIAFLPFPGGQGMDPDDAHRRGGMEASASGAAIVRAARRAGVADAGSARSVFAAAASADPRARATVLAEATLIAKAIGAIVLIADPELVVLGGGIGRADGFADMVGQRLAALIPVVPEIRVSALGTEAVVDGCLASGLGRVWRAIAEGIHPARVDVDGGAAANGVGYSDGGRRPAG